MKKIMFDSHYGLEWATLHGRKTNTRRKEKALDKTVKGYETKYNTPFKIISQYYDSGLERLVLRTPNEPIYFKPRFLLGEVVAVARRYSDLRFVAPPGADAEEFRRLVDNCIHSAGWNNKMFVEASIMPSRILFTDVRVERLQDISDEDCLREGVRALKADGIPDNYTFDNWMFKNGVFRCSDTPREAFAELIKKISGKRSWEDNPYVVVYEYRLIK